MKHYSNHHSKSREYYKGLQKNNLKNLNSKTKKLDKTEVYLEKFLSMTYKYLSPIFEDDDVMTSFKNETTTNFIDKKVDEQIIEYTPSWIQSFITFFIELYDKYFPKPSGIKLLKIINHISKFINSNNVVKHKMTNNFILNKSSP